MNINCQSSTLYENVEVQTVMARVIAKAGALRCGAEISRLVVLYQVSGYTDSEEIADGSSDGKGYIKIRLCRLLYNKSC
jgi:hypothetical protein